MRTAIYIEDGVVQLVLTPEGEFEKNALGSFEGKALGVRIMAGQFYDCQGGWTRHTDTYGYGGFSERTADRSLILRVLQEKLDAQT